MNVFIKNLQEEFEQHKDFIIAKKQSAYMQNLFPFLGLQKPIRAEIEKNIFKKNPIFHEEDLYFIIKKLFEMDFREYQYTACNLGINIEKFFQKILFLYWNI